jgi:hypothetical protein
MTNHALLRALEVARLAPQILPRMLAHVRQFRRLKDLPALNTCSPARWSRKLVTPGRSTWIEFGRGPTNLPPASGCWTSTTESIARSTSNQVVPISSSRSWRRAAATSITNPRCAIGRGPCDRRGSRAPTARSGSKTLSSTTTARAAPQRLRTRGNVCRSATAALEIERGEVPFSEPMSRLYRAPGKEGVSDGRYRNYSDH